MSVDRLSRLDVSGLGARMGTALIIAEREVDEELGTRC